MIKQSEEPDNSVHAHRPAATASARKRINSGELFGAVRELVIEHVGEEYRLRITSQGKLILTK